MLGILTKNKNQNKRKQCFKISTHCSGEWDQISAKVFKICQGSVTHLELAEKRKEAKRMRLRMRVSTE